MSGTDYPLRATRRSIFTAGSLRGGWSIVNGKLTSIGRKPHAPMLKLSGFTKLDSDHSLSSARRHESSTSFSAKNSSVILSYSSSTFGANSSSCLEQSSQCSSEKTRHPLVSHRNARPTLVESSLDFPRQSGDDRVTSNYQLSKCRKTLEVLGKL